MELTWQCEECKCEEVACWRIINRSSKFESTVHHTCMKHVGDFCCYNGTTVVEPIVLLSFAQDVRDILKRCTNVPPAGETWSATDDGVLQYLRDLVAFANLGRDET